MHWRQKNTQVNGNNLINFFAFILSWTMCGLVGKPDDRKQQNVNFGGYKSVILQ